MHNRDKPYYALSAYLRERYGCKVCKVTLDIGLSCPNRDGTVAVGGCAFCDPDTLVPLGFTSATPVEAQLADGIKRLVQRHGAKKYIAYFNINSSTHAGVDLLRLAYAPALNHPEVVAVAISTRPDCLGPDVIELLGEMAEVKDVWVELGLQSANDATLKLLNRGHTFAAYADAVERAHAAGIKVCTHIIAGLPGEGEKEYLQTVRELAAQRVWGVKFHQLQVVAGTKMEEFLRSGTVTPLSIERYAAMVAAALNLLPRSTVIHRLSGDLPDRFIVAPKWGANKFLIADRITAVIGRSVVGGSPAPG